MTVGREWEGKGREWEGVDGWTTTHEKEQELVMEKMVRNAQTHVDQITLYFKSHRFTHAADNQ